MYKVNIHVLLKDDVLDPQGKTVQNALNHLNYNGIENVRIGKFIELTIQETDENKLKQSINDMCKQILTNTVIEKYNFSYEKIIS